MKNSSSGIGRYRAVVYHGGAGGGLHRSFANFPIPLLYVSFEPNSQSQEELLLQKKSSTPKASIVHDVVNAAVSNTTGKKKFYEYSPFIFSSFLPLNKDVSWRYQFEKVRLLKSSGVNCTTIDQVAKQRKEHPRFICLDIQGYELKTLQGASSSLNRDILGVRCEVNFLKIYRDMPSMDEISSYMESKGFFLARIEKCGSGKTGFSTDCGPFSRSWDDARPAWADAIFLKTPKKLIENFKLHSSPEILLAQYIAFCLANECKSLALDMLYEIQSSSFKNIPRKLPIELKDSIFRILTNHLQACNDAKLKHDRRLTAQYKKIRTGMKKYLTSNFR